MAVPILTYNASSPYSFTPGADAKDAVVAINNAITTEAPAGITISDYSATEAHIELQFTAGLSGFSSSMRILIFGGQAPNIGSLKGSTSASASYLYFICAPTAGTSGPDQSYTVGDPYTSLNTLGVICGNATLSTIDRLRFWWSQETIFFQFYDDNASISFPFGAGAVASTVDGDTRRYGVIGNGSASLAANFWNATAGSGAGICPEEGPSTTDTKTSFVIDEASDNAVCYRSLRLTSSDHLKNWDGSQSVTMNVPMHTNEENMTIGNLRQVYAGPQAMIGQTMTMVGGATAYAVTGSTITAQDAYYLGNA